MINNIRNFTTILQYWIDLNTNDIGRTLPDVIGRTLPDVHEHHRTDLALVRVRPLSLPNESFLSMSGSFIKRTNINELLAERTTGRPPNVRFAYSPKLKFWVSRLIQLICQVAWLQSSCSPCSVAGGQGRECSQITKSIWSLCTYQVYHFQLFFISINRLSIIHYNTYRQPFTFLHSLS